jgi:hypothetical protein
MMTVSRASVYRPPAPASDEDLAIMALIDRQYLARPYYGSRRMAAWLATQNDPNPNLRLSPIPQHLAGLGVDRYEVAVGLATKQETPGRHGRAASTAHAIRHLMLPHDLVCCAVDRREGAAQRRADRRRLAAICIT